MAKIVYRVGAESWEFHLIPHRSYISKFGKDSDAICLLKEREVWFDKTSFNLSVIAHELMHVYFQQSTHNSSELDSHQTEEVAAEIVAKNWAQIAFSVQDIYTQLSGKA